MSFLILALVLLVVASLCDFWWHEVPDWLNFSFLAGGVGLSVLLTISEMSWIPLLMSVAGIVLFGALGFGMFFSGQWGGGDVKTLLALGSLLGAWFDPFHVGVSFFVNIFPAAALYGIVWFVILVSKHFSRVRTSLLRKKHFLNILPFLFLLSIVSILSGVFLLRSLYQFVVIIVGIGIPVLVILYYVVKAVEGIAFVKSIVPSRLTDGDWLASPVIVRGKIIVDSGGTGVTVEDIDLLKRLHSKGVVKSVLVKYGLPFVPAFLLSFVLTLLFGNMFFLLL